MKRFPTYQDLTKEQDRALNLPLDGTYLVVGPPGTGKTVVALHRTAMLHDRGDSTLLITKMKTLREYTGSVIQQLGIDGQIHTFDSWFWHYYKDHIGTAPPSLGRYVYDWDGIFATLMKCPPPKHSLPHLIIDEGQDIPREFYGITRFLAKNLTIFADENQRIRDDNSSVEDIQRETEIAGDEVVPLTINHRNTREIASLAASFYCGLRSGIPTLPERSGGLKPEVRAYPSLDENIEAIRRFERVNDDLQVGVLVPDRRTLKKFVSALSGKTKHPVRFYDSQDRETKGKMDLRFGDPGIIVLIYDSAKGLEFDAVFMPELQRAAKGESSSCTTVGFRMRMYVMISRARDRLYLSYTGDRPPLLDTFPKALCDWKGGA